MNASIPPSLAPYIYQCVQQRSLTLLTSVLDTPANWLLVRFIYAALDTSGSPTSTSSLLPKDGNGIIDGQKVVLISIWRSLSLWEELLKKCGVVLPDVINSGKLCYIDGLSLIQSSPANDSQGIINIEPLDVQGLQSALSKALQALSLPNAKDQITVLIDGIDFLLALEPTVSSTTIQQFILDVQSRVHSVVVTCGADSALLHSTEPSATPLELEHSILARSLAHQSTSVFQLRPLETGQSKDVSGSVRVSHGGSWDSVEDGKYAEEGEWLYHLRSDGSVKVWGRGEA